jgi:hypothetical protein
MDYCGEVMAADYYLDTAVFDSNSAWFVIAG